MSVPSSGEVRTLDDLARDLRTLREEAGSPSYADIALGVARVRQARGIPEAEARPGRTTVYDVFRDGRRRIDVDLVVDIVRALGADDDQAARWAASCRAARAQDPAPEPAPGPEPEPAPQGPEAPVRAPVVRRIGWVVAGCVVLNLLGRGLVELLGIPLHLDMVGTAIAAVVLGPWWGALVGVTTNVAGVPISGPESLPFALVNVAGALCWGYGVRRFGMGRTIGRFLLLSVVVALVCTAVAVPILQLLYGGSTGHGANAVTLSFAEVSRGFVVAVLSANLVTSLADKLISGFVALAALDAVRDRAGSWPD